MKIIYFVLLLTSYSLASNQEVESWQQTDKSRNIYQPEFSQDFSSQRDEVIINMPSPPQESSSIFLKPFQWVLSYFTKQENPKGNSGEWGEIV
jgi:hypothetical protein